MTAKAMTVAGIMSGTSADGIDVALVRIEPGKSRLKITLLAHEGFAFPSRLRLAVLAAMNASAISTAELARLNWRLGIAFGEAVQATIKKHKVKIEGAEKEVTGEQYLAAVMNKVFGAGGAPAVSLMKEIREATEGQKMVVEASLTDLTPAERKKRIAELEAKRAARK